MLPDRSDKSSVPIPPPAPGVPSERELVLAAIDGEHEALSALLSRFGTQVRLRLTGKISPQHRRVLDEDDVMQVTYLEAFMRIGRFNMRGDGSFLAWLTQIAENNLRDAIRGLERIKRPDAHGRAELPRNHEDSYAALVDLLGVTTTTPSRVAARHEAAGIMDMALAVMPADYQKVVRMYDLEGRGIDEVAQAIGKSIGAVYMMRARAHDRLRDAMGTASQFFSAPG